MWVDITGFFFVRKNSPPALSCAFFRFQLSFEDSHFKKQFGSGWGMLSSLFYWKTFSSISSHIKSYCCRCYIYVVLLLNIYHVCVCVCLRIRMELFLTAEHLEKYEKNCFQNDNRTSIMLLNFPHDEQVFHQTSSKLNIISTAWAFRWILKYVVNFFWSTELWQRVMKIYRLKLWASWRANTEFNHTLSEILN